MRLKILLPTKTLVDREITKVIAEADNGIFCLLPRHADITAALVPGLLAFETGGRETFLAVDEGVLVKAGDEVRVAVRNAVEGRELGQLRNAVEERFRAADEKQKTARSAAARMEAGLVRRFIELEERDG